jgi:cell division protease FtsH
MWGREKRNKVVDEKERRMIAFHEAGHAMMAHLLPDAEPLHKVGIIPRGMMLGATMHLPKRDSYVYGKRKAMAEIATLMGGRIAEELFCDDIQAGASSDLKRATEIARKMVCQWGMSKELGPVVYRDVEEHLFLGREIARNEQVSPAVSEKIDREIRKIIDEAAETARNLLSAHAEHVKAVVEELLVREVLTAPEVDLIIQYGSLKNSPSGQAASPAPSAAPEGMAKDNIPAPERGRPIGEPPPPAASLLDTPPVI